MSNRNRAVCRGLLSAIIGLSSVMAGDTASANRAVAVAPVAETVLLNGNVLTADARHSIAQATAIRGGRILAIGSNQVVRRHLGKATRIIDLHGKTVIPGFIATHCHSVGVAYGTLAGPPHAELLSIAAIQNWIRKRAAELPAGTWIRVPRNDITRIKERRHPTPAELDAATTTHPVVFTAARKSALNSLGFRLLGISTTAQQKKTLPKGVRVIRDKQGNPRLLVGGSGLLRKVLPRKTFSDAQMLSALRNVHRHYNAVGITSIFERALTPSQYHYYKLLHDRKLLTVRTTATFRQQFQNGKDVERYTRTLGLKTGDGDDWLRVGPLKITVDGGIHWGNTRLREPYGPKRTRFYVLDDPNYRGDLYYSVARMRSIFLTGHRLGWQMGCHVTGDAGVDRVLDALEAVQREFPINTRRFTLIHAYFPAADAIRRAKRLGICVDTQVPLYYKDSDAIHDIYGPEWAARFIGIGDWLRGGIPTAINGDHMIGLDPDTAMNAFDPFLMLSVAVTRRNRSGHVYGPRQRISRRQALDCLTRTAAYLGFDEYVKGSLEPGKLADLAVFDHDYLTCPEEQIASIKVLLTMVGGKIVYQRAARFSSETR